MKIFRTWTFLWWEISILKLSLLSLGILIGIYFYEYVADLTWLWWTLFAITVTYFIPRIFKNDKE